MKLTTKDVYKQVQNFSCNIFHDYLFQLETNKFSNGAIKKSVAFYCKLEFMLANCVF